MTLFLSCLLTLVIYLKYNKLLLKQLSFAVTAYFMYVFGQSKTILTELSEWIHVYGLGKGFNIAFASRLKRVLLWEGNNTSLEYKLFPFRLDYFFFVLFVLRFYGPVNPRESCRARSVYLVTRLLGGLSPLSGSPVLCTFFCSFNIAFASRLKRVLLWEGNDTTLEYKLFPFRFHSFSLGVCVQENKQGSHVSCIKAVYQVYSVS